MLEQYINSRKIIRRENKIFCCQNCCFRRCYLCARSRLSIDSSYKEGTQRSRHSNTKHILPYFSRFIYIYIYRFLEFLSHRSNFTSCSHYISLLYNYYIVKFVKITVLKSIAQTFFGTITKKKELSQVIRNARINISGDRFSKRSHVIENVPREKQAGEDANEIFRSFARHDDRIDPVESIDTFLLLLGHRRVLKLN